jgi:molybdopterin-guanine dinucleotide biosynthesis protein A
MENLNYNHSMLSLVIQAGGESRRMGRDKGLTPFLGVPLALHVAQRLAHLADEIWVTTNHLAEYEPLGLQMISDLAPGRGALGGLYTALSAARFPLVAVAACDMPFASPKIFTAALELLESGGYDAVVPKTAYGAEPFHAVYRRETCLPAITAALKQDAWRADSWYPNMRIRFFLEEEIRHLDPQGLAFSNVNNPEELAQAEKRAREMQDS